MHLPDFEDADRLISMVGSWASESTTESYLARRKADDDAELLREQRVIEAARRFQEEEDAQKWREAEQRKSAHDREEENARIAAQRSRDRAEENARKAQSEAARDGEQAQKARECENMIVEEKTDVVAQKEVTADVTREQAKRMPRRLKMELPMILMGKTISSTADSGSEENIIAVDVLSALKIEIKDAIEDEPGHQKEFRMGNNRVMKAIGRIAIVCSFARDQTVRMGCWFYVFQTLITPLIMGMAFLDETETLTKHKHRLQPRASLLSGPLVCASLNNPKRRLRCFAAPAGWAKIFGYGDPKWREKYTTLANADTGSELDLVSLDYCKRHNIAISPVDQEYSEVQFADGSVSSLVGQVNIRVIIGRWTGDVLGRTFYVLPDLTCDMLFGEEFLDEFDAFETCQDSIVLKDDSDLSQINTIVWLRTHERLFFGLFQSSREHSTTDVALMDQRSEGNAGRPAVRSFRSTNEGPRSAQQESVPRKMGLPRSVFAWLAHRTSIKSLRKPPHLTSTSEQDLDTQIDEHDARENRRREEAKKMIKLLPPLQRPKATEREAKMVAAFDRDRELLISLRDKNHN